MSIKSWNESKGWTFDGQVELQGIEAACQALIALSNEPYPANSPQERAQDILSLIKVVRDYIGQGNADLAARYALALGQRVAEMWAGIEG